VFAKWLANVKKQARTVGKNTSKDEPPLTKMLFSNSILFGLI